MTTPAPAPPGHQPRLFNPAPGVAPTYTVTDRRGHPVATTAALGVALARAAALAEAEGWAWITDSTGTAARLDADGAVTSDTTGRWVAVLQPTPKETP